MTGLRPSSRVRWLVISLVYVALTLAYSRRLLPVIGSALPNDTGDPGLNTWILWWNAHAVPLTTRWWDAPIFYPVRGALALSETLLNLWPVSTPLQWAGLSPVLTYNLLFLLSFPTAALAAHALAHRLTGRHDAGFIAGLAYGFAPYRAAQMPHLQTLWSCWMPLGLLALHKYLDRRRNRDLLLFAVCWLMNGLATGYFLFFFAVLVGLWVVWFARSMRDWLAIGATIAIASLPLVPLLLGYQHFQAAFGVTRTTTEIEYYSADLSALWATTPYVLPHAWTIQPGPEGELYPGVTVLALLIVGSIVAWRRVPRDRPYRLQPWLFGIAGLVTTVALYSWYSGRPTFSLLGIKISLTHPVRTISLIVAVVALATFWNQRIVQGWRRRSTLFFYAVSTGLMLLFALGPHAKLFGTTFFAQAPYYWLMQLPGGHAFRVPARFAMLFALCAAIGAALGYVRLARRTRLLVAVLVCTAVALEGFVFKMEVAEVPRPLPVSGMDRGAVLLELPMVDVFSDTAAMLRATQVGYTLINGFSGYIPPHYGILSEGVANFDPDVLAALQGFGSMLVFINKERDPDDRYQNFVAQAPGAHRVLATEQGALYQLPAQPRVEPTLRRPLAIKSVTASINNKEVWQMLDGDVRTRWDTARHQAAGDELRIELQQPATLNRLELDLGPFPADYPRRLRVSALIDGTRQTLREGTTAGVAMAGALRDPMRATLAMNLAGRVTTQTLVLTVLDGHETNAWSVAELRVFSE